MEPKSIKLKQLEIVTFYPHDAQRYNQNHCLKVYWMTTIRSFLSFTNYNQGTSYIGQLFFQFLSCFEKLTNPLPGLQVRLIDGVVRYASATSAPSTATYSMLVLAPTDTVYNMMHFAS